MRKLNARLESLYRATEISVAQLFLSGRADAQNSKTSVRRANFESARAKNENCVIIQAQRAQDLRLRNFPSAHSIGASQIFARPKLIYYIYVVNFHMQPSAGAAACRRAGAIDRSKGQV